MISAGAVSVRGQTGPPLSSAEPTSCAPLEVIIPTFNERENLPHAIESVRGWVSKIFVVDSGSTDGTQELARQLGAEVVEHRWEGYARQKNWALDHLPLAQPWIYILDADETMTPSLRNEIVSLTSRPPESVRESGFYVNRYLVFMGKRILHCGYFPSWNLRLFKRGTARYEDRAVHEHMVVQGKTGYLKGLMEHEDRRGLEYYIAKHNRYSTLEAEALFFGERENSEQLKATPFGNSLERRRFFKTRIYPGLPGKWLWRFIWMYAIKLGALDGTAGLRLCLLISSHELFTSLKLAELQQHASRRHRAGPARGWRTSRRQVLPQPPIPEGLKHAGSTPGRNDTDRLTGEAGHAVGATASALPSNGAAVAKAAEHAPAMLERSPWTFMEKVKRVIWMAVSSALFRPSFHNWYGWRRMLLRIFGAEIGHDVKIRPTTMIEIPWHVKIGDESVIGDYAILYSLGQISIGRRVVISQYAHLCAGTHDYTARDFPLLRPPITIGDGAWIAADAFIGPGVTVGRRAIVGARASAFSDLPADMICIGNPAKPIKRREST